MALMRDPTEVDAEVIKEQDTVVALEEDGDVAQENSEYASQKFPIGVQPSNYP